MRFLVSLIALAFVAVCITILVGFLSPAANRSHSGAVYQAIAYVVDAGIRWSAKDIIAPEMNDNERVRVGMTELQGACVQCHGAPGTAPETFALGMTPVPPSLMQAARDRPANEIFWITKNGIRASGMPSWGFKMSDEQIWDIVAAVKALRNLSPREYYRMAGLEPPQSGDSTNEDIREVAGNAQSGRIAVKQFGCTACHQISGVPGPKVWVGPPLEGIAEQQFLAGVLPNTPQNLVRWIMQPQKVDPLSAMPDVGVDRQSAEDIAAYLQGR